MDSLKRKVALRRQAQDAAAAVARAEALARATQVAHSTVAVGDDDVPVIETLEEAVSVSGDLVVVAEGSEQAESDAFDALIAERDLAAIVDELTLVPASPTGLTVASNVGAFTATGPRATVGLSWSAVTESVEGAPLEGVSYRVYVDGALRAEVATLTASISVPSQVSAEVRVTAVVDGLESDRSPIVSVTGALPATFVLTPTVPVLSSSHGNVRAVWDGEYTSAAPAGAHTVRVEARVGSGAWVQQGSALTGAGEQLVSVGSIGQSVQVRFRAFDQLGRLTGTSAVETITVAGVEFQDFDSATQDMLSEMGDKITLVESGQAVISRTVDGLNRRFTSLDAPKRGVFRQTGGTVEVFENLAPKIEPSDTWAEVRRNQATNPTADAAGSGWSSNNGPEEPVTKGVPVPAPHPAGVTTCIEQWSVGNRTPIMNLHTVGGYTTGSLTPGTPVSVYVWVSHEGYRLSGVWGTFTPFPVQEWVRLETVVNESGNVPALVIFAISGNADPSHRAYATGAVIGDTGPYFDGSTPQGSVDPDMRQRWLGAENASESVMEIERVAGFWSTRCIAGVSVKNGKPAVRQIPTDTLNSDSHISFLIPTVAQGGGTMLGSATLDSPLSGPLNARSRVLLTVMPVDYHSSVPNEAGTYQQRLSFVTTSIHQMRLMHGGYQGSGDVWWTDIGLYAGELPEDAIPFHQGDQWYQLGYKPGVNEGDPDRLVIEHIHIWNGQDWVHHDIWAENIFAAGSVTARTINFDEAFGDALEVNEVLAGRIGVDQLVPGTGNSIDISGNVTIQGIRDTTDALETGVETAQTTAETAQTAAAIADGKALTAQSMIDTLDTDLSDHKKFFSVNDGVPEVSTEDGEYVLRVDANRISMMHGGQEVTYWSNTQFVVREINIIQGMLANHWVESLGDSGTVIKPRSQA